MRVVFIVSEHIAVPRRPLSGIFQWHQAQALRNAGVDVEILSAAFVPARIGEWIHSPPSVEIVDGIRVSRRYVRSLLPFRMRSVQSAVAKAVSMGEELFDDYVRRRGLPDVLHAHNLLYAGAAAAAIRERHQIAAVLTEHSSAHVLRPHSSEVVARLIEISSRIDCVVAVSETLARTLKRSLARDDIGVLPNVVEPGFGAPTRDSVPRSGFTFISVGRLDTNKNHASLIRAFHDYIAEPACRLRIVGAGPERARLQRLIRQLGEGARIELTGRLDRTQLQRALSSASCFVLPSRYETFAVVVIEALAVGLPVVSTRCGGPESIVQSFNGILVPPDDDDALGTALRKMLDQSATFRRDEIRQACLQEFGGEAFAQKAELLYQRASNAFLHSVGISSATT